MPAMRSVLPYLLSTLLSFTLFAPSAFAHTGLGIDIDFYTGPIPRSVWRQVKAANQKFVIVQAWGGRSRNEFAVSQLAGARSIGMKTAAYVLLNYDGMVCSTYAHPVRNNHGSCADDLNSQDELGGRWQVRQGLAALGPELQRVSFIAIDVEWFASPAPSLDTAEQERRRQDVVDAIDEVKKHHKRAVIYTRNSSGHWNDITGCGATPAAPGCGELYKRIHDPVTPIALWDVQRGDPELTNFRPHGAWTTRLGRQYKLNTNMFGLPPEKTVDLNVFDLSLFSVQPSRILRSNRRPTRSPSRKSRAAAGRLSRRNG
jgi:hypothetical protein